MRLRHNNSFEFNKEDSLEENLEENQTRSLHSHSFDSFDEIDNIMSNNNVHFYKQSWFIPVVVLIIIIMVLQMAPLNMNRSITPTTTLSTTVSFSENVETLVKSQIRQQLLDISSSKLYDQKISYPPILKIPDSKRLRILVTGGAGFVGSHLVDRLMLAGHQVTVIDNMFTGRHKNIAHWFGHPNFQLIIHDVVQSIMLEVDQIYHLACPASPPHYQYNPIKTIKTSTEGTLNMLGLAKRVRVSIVYF